MADGRIYAIVPCWQLPGRILQERSRDAEASRAQNVMLVPKEVIEALQAAQLLPTD
jgi:hypothetical protein